MEHQGSAGGEGSHDFASILREVQSDFAALTEVYGRQRSLGNELSEMMKTLQREADAVIQIRPETLGKKCMSAYLVSEGVVLTFDENRNMTSKPLGQHSPEVIVSVFEDCAPTLRKLLSNKRQVETQKVESLENVFRELKKVEETFSIFRGRHE